MSFFNNNPFSKILSFWLAGLILGFYAPPAKPLLLIISGCLAVLSLAKLKSRAYPFDIYLSAFYASCLVLLAFLSIDHPSIPNSNATQHFTATILEYTTEKTNSYQNLIRINQADSSCFEGQKVMVYFEKDSLVKELQPGDLIVAEGRIQRIKNSNNLSDFNYQAFMANRKIYFSAYLPTNNYQLTSTNTSSILHIAERFRLQLINCLKGYIKNDESLQVISALTLGYRKELSPDTRSYFASTGAMHVLAVSGLHVGMIYLFLTYMLGFLRRTQIGRLTFVLIIGFLLWSYALITGFSPSVQRATVMFSFIVVANSLRRPASIYNSIAASAFLLLLINPNLIFEVGFQLSYAAVISIVFFFPKIEILWTPKNKAIKWAWQLFCISLAAQIGTFPLSIFYFHQFPAFFWLSNFIVIPAAYLILASTFLFFITYPITGLALFLSKLLSSITLITISLIKKIDQIPYSLIENINISMIQLFILLAILLSSMSFIKVKRKAFLFIPISLFLLLQITSFSQKLLLFNQRKYIVYENAKCLHLVNGRKNYLICNELKDDSFRTTPYLIRKLHLATPIIVQLDNDQNIKFDDLMIYQQTLLFIDQTFQYNKRKEKRQQINSKNQDENAKQTDLSKVFMNTKIDLVLENGKILDFNNLPVAETVITDF